MCNMNREPSPPHSPCRVLILPLATNKQSFECFWHTSFIFLGERKFSGFAQELCNLVYLYERRFVVSYYPKYCFYYKTLKVFKNSKSFPSEILGSKQLLSRHREGIAGRTLLILASRASIDAVSIAKQCSTFFILNNLMTNLLLTTLFYLI